MKHVIEWLRPVLLVWGVLLLIHGVDADGWPEYAYLIGGPLLIGSAVDLIRRPE